MKLRLKSVGSEWIDGGPPEDRGRRRNVVALLSLDVSVAAPANLGSEALQLLEWGCDLLRHDQPTEFEREWMLASIRIAEQQRADAFLLESSCGNVKPPPCNHVRHAISRFPDDRRFRAAGLFARREVNVLTKRPVGFTSLVNIAPPGAFRDPVAAQKTAETKVRIEETLAGLRRLTSDPIVGVQAMLRLAIVHFELGELDESRRVLRTLLAAGPAPFDQYLARLVLGFSFEADGRMAEARDEFAAAVRLDPAVLSGALELSRYDFLAGRRDEASSTIDRALHASLPHDDPWQFPCADCNGWTAALDRLHAMVRR